MTGSQTGKVAIVTGGSANLGKLFAESLASDGANVVVHYNSPRRADEAQGVVNDLKATGVEAIAHQGDPLPGSPYPRLVADRQGGGHRESAPPTGPRRPNHHDPLREDPRRGRLDRGGRHERPSR